MLITDPDYDAFVRRVEIDGDPDNVTIELETARGEYKVEIPFHEFAKNIAFLVAKHLEIS